MKNICRILLIINFMLATQLYFVRPAYSGAICQGSECVEFVVKMIINSVNPVNWLHSMKSSHEYTQKQIKDIQKISFEIYKINYLPEGVMLGDTYIDGYYADIESVKVSTHLKRKDRNLWSEDVYTPDSWKTSWGRIYQFKAKEIYGFPSNCPSDNFLATHKFLDKCDFLIATKNGYNLYKNVNFRMHGEIVSAQIGNTLVVLKYYRKFKGEDIEQILAIFDSLSIYTKEELKKCQKRYLSLF